LDLSLAKTSIFKERELINLSNRCVLINFVGDYPKLGNQDL